MRRKVYYIRNNLKYYNITLQKKDVIKYNGYNFKYYVILNHVSMKKLDNLLFYYKLKGHEINFGSTGEPGIYGMYINNHTLDYNLRHGLLSIEEIKDIENIITNNLEVNIDYEEFVDYTGFLNYEDAKRCFNDLFNNEHVFRILNW